MIKNFLIKVKNRGETDRHIFVAILNITLKNI